MKMDFWKADRVAGLIWLLLGMFLCLESVELKLGEFHKPGPGFTPFLWGALLGGLGLILVIAGPAGGIGEGKPGLEGKGFLSKGNRKTLLCTMGVVLGYILLFEPLGFIPATLLFFFSLAKLTRPGQWLFPLLFSAGSVSVAYLVFSLWLKCQLPEGILGF